MVKCANCGQENNPGSTFCAFCGFNIQPATESAPPPAQTPPMQTAPPPVSRPVYQQPQAQPAYRPPVPSGRLPESSLAPIILILAIGGFFLCQILGPVAWVMAHNERQKVARGEIAPSGVLTAGWIIAIVDTVFLGLFILYMIGAVAIGM